MMNNHYYSGCVLKPLTVDHNPACFNFLVVLSVTTFDIRLKLGLLVFVKEQVVLKACLTIITLVDHLPQCDVTKYFI